MSIKRHITLPIILCFVSFFLTTAWPAVESDFDIDYDIAWGYYNRGDIDKALSLFGEMQVKYPGDTKLYLTLGSIHLELGDYDLAGDELMEALQHDPPFEVMVGANLRLGHVLLKKGALDAAERHYRAAIVKGAGTDIIIDAAYGLQRVKVQRFLEGRYESRNFLIHYFPFGAIGQMQLDLLTAKLEEAYKGSNEILKLTKDVPLEIYLYPNAEAFTKLFGEGADIIYPEHNEIHEIYDPDYDYVEPVAEVLYYRLQVEMNRHGDSDFVKDALPFIVRGGVDGIGLGTYVNALINQRYFVDLKILRHPSFYPLVDNKIRGPEAASFIEYLHKFRGDVDIRQFLTQPNLEALYGLDTLLAQKLWLSWVTRQTPDPDITEDKINSVLAFVHKFDLVQMVPDAAQEAFKDGLTLIDAGDELQGRREIQEAMDLFPDFGLAEYALGKLDFKQGDYARSRGNFEDALKNLTEKGTSWGWAQYYLGAISELEEKYGEAITHYERTLEADVPMGVRAIAAEKKNGLVKLADIAPTPGAEFDHQDLLDIVNMFTFIDINLMKGNFDDLAPLFTTVKNQNAFIEFKGSYSKVLASFDAPILMHEVASIESAGDVIKAKVIVKLQVPESEIPKIGAFEDYLKLRRGENRYFLIIRDESGIKIADFTDAPSLEGHAQVLEEGGTVIPYKEGGS